MSGMASGDSGLASLGRALAGTPNQSTDALWRSLAWFNAYRLLVAVLMLVMAAVLGGHISFGSRNLPLFVYSRRAGSRWRWPASCCSGCAGTSCCSCWASGGRHRVRDAPHLRERRDLERPAAAAAHVARRGRLVSRGRLSLFFAAIASLAVLLEHTLQVLSTRPPPASTSRRAW